jgi:hypothetical protein
MFFLDGGHGAAGITLQVIYQLLPKLGRWGAGYDFVFMVDIVMPQVFLVNDTDLFGAGRLRLHC